MRDLWRLVRRFGIRDGWSLWRIRAYIIREKARKARLERDRVRVWRENPRLPGYRRKGKHG